MWKWLPVVVNLQRIIIWTCSSLLLYVALRQVKVHYFVFWSATSQHSHCIVCIVFSCRCYMYCWQLWYISFKGYDMSMLCSHLAVKVVVNTSLILVIYYISLLFLFHSSFIHLFILKIKLKLVQTHLFYYTIYTPLHPLSG